MCIRDSSYQGLCSLIHAKTKGRDGVYFTYTEEAPIAFNPFYVEDGVYDVEKLSLIHISESGLWPSSVHGALRPVPMSYSDYSLRSVWNRHPLSKPDMQILLSKKCT